MVALIYDTGYHARLIRSCPCSKNLSGHPSRHDGASKSGLAGITRLLANEWAAKGVNVNAIAPGYMATDNTAALRADEVRNREIMARLPAGRWREPADLGGAAVFASRASDYVHGATIPVDGGWLAR